jgi:carboxyl-terminal processing protease
MRLTRLCLLAACALATACSIPEPTGPAEFEWTPPVYVGAILNLMELNSVNRLKIDWPAFRGQVTSASVGAKSLEETHPAILLALTLLGDGHSTFTSASGTVLRFRNRTCNAATVTTPSPPGSIGYVRVGGFSGNAVEALSFADGIQAAIRSMDRDNLAGWIVDLRGNGGGNMWPMLAGVGPILAPGLAGSFIDPSGQRITWEYRDGGSFSGGFLVQGVTSSYRLKKESPRVAVLTDNRVASSGEATAIAFRGRPDTRSFGGPTCGLSTANRAFEVGDGSTLNLTVSTMADRTGRSYGDPVVPDEVISDGDPVARAVEWLQTGR